MTDDITEAVHQRLTKENEDTAERITAETLSELMDLDEGPVLAALYELHAQGRVDQQTIWGALRTPRAPEVHVRATKYTVCAYPRDDANRSHFEVVVELRHDGKWCVSHLGMHLGNDGTWGYDWDRFDLVTALRMARDVAPTVRCNGNTIKEVLAHVAEVEARRQEGNQR